MPIPPSPPATPSPRAPEIHTMPDEFIGAPPGAATPQPSVAASAPPPPRPAVAPAPTRTLPAPKRRGSKVLIFSGIGILAALVVGAYFLLRTPTPQRSSSASPAAVKRPTATTTPAAPATTTPRSAAPATSTPAATTSRLPERNAFDSDVDGLTDDEERLYGSDPVRPDTDNDGFLDGNEVFNLYSPTAPDPATLRDVGQALPYTDSLGRYELLVPRGFAASTFDATAGTVRFTAPNAETVTVSVEDNTAGLSLEEWYARRTPGVSTRDYDQFVSKGGYHGLRTRDRGAVYISSGERIVIVEYAIGTLPEASYRRTFEMMVNAVHIPVPAIGPPEAEPGG